MEITQNEQVDKDQVLHPDLENLLRFIKCRLRLFKCIKVIQI